MFELPLKSTYGLVSRMIIDEELRGACDEPTESVVMAHVEPSALQRLAMTFAEKCAVLLDANERALELHVGTGGAQLFDYEEEGGGASRRGGRGGGKGGRESWRDDDGGRGRDGAGAAAEEAAAATTGGGGRKRYQESYGNFSTRRGAGDGDFSKRGGGKFKKQEKSEEVGRTERMVSLGSAGGDDSIVSYIRLSESGEVVMTIERLIEKKSPHDVDAPSHQRPAKRGDIFLPPRAPSAVLPGSRRHVRLELGANRRHQTFLR